MYTQRKCFLIYQVSMWLNRLGKHLSLKCQKLRHYIPQLVVFNIEYFYSRKINENTAGHGSCFSSATVSDIFQQCSLLKYHLLPHQTIKTHGEKVSQCSQISGQIWHSAFMSLEYTSIYFHKAVFHFQKVKVIATNPIIGPYPRFYKMNEVLSNLFHFFVPFLSL